MEVNLKIKNLSRTEPGITVIECLVVAGILAVIVAIILPMTARVHTCCMRISCVSNLREIGTAFVIWKNDHSESYPMELSTNEGGSKEYTFGSEVFRHFQAMQDSFGQDFKVLHCPEDKKRFAATNFVNFGNSNLSYFVGVTVSATNLNPDLFLSGDRNLTNAAGLGRGPFFLTTNGSVGWSVGIHGDKHTPAGNILCNDGRAVVLRTIDLTAALRKSGVVPGPLAIP